MTRPISFSIITAAYNAEQTLPQCIESVCKQSTYADIRHIIVNDGSADNTPNIAKQYASKHSHIEVITHDKNRGLASALNTGIKASKSDYVCFLDADDAYFPYNIEDKAIICTENPHIPGVFQRMAWGFTAETQQQFSNRVYTVPQYTIYQNYAAPALFTYQNRFIHGKGTHMWQWAYRRDLIELCEKMQFLGTDNEFLFRMIDKLPYFAVSNYVGVLYNQNGGFSAPADMDKHYKDCQSYIDFVKSRQYGPIGTILRDTSVRNVAQKIKDRQR